MNRQEKIAQFKKQREEQQAAKQEEIQKEKEKLSQWYSESQPTAQLDAEISALKKRKAALPPSSTAEHAQIGQILEHTLKKKLEFTQAMLENTAREVEIKRRMLESRQRQERLMADLERVEQKLKQAKDEESQRKNVTALQEAELSDQMGRLSMLLKMQQVVNGDGRGRGGRGRGE